MGCALHGHAMNNHRMLAHQRPRRTNHSQRARHMLIRPRIASMKLISTKGVVCPHLILLWTTGMSIRDKYDANITTMTGHIPGGEMTKIAIIPLMLLAFWPSTAPSQETGSELGAIVEKCSIDEV